MSFAPTSPITGATITAFTSPTYTLTADTPPNANSKQYAVTALGGTQTGVDVNAVSKPFTITMFRPPVLKPLPQANVTTGVIPNIGVNVYKILSRKGSVPAANQVPQLCRITTSIEVPAGCDAYEVEELRAAWSAHVGCLWGNSQAICDVLTTGVL
jgi:hypothetical protein